MSDLRVRIAAAIGSIMATKAELEMPAWDECDQEARDVLLEIADIAVEEVMKNFGLRADGRLFPEKVLLKAISAEDVRHVLDMHRDSADIVWGDDCAVNALRFTDTVILAANDVSPEARIFGEGETYAIFRPHLWKVLSNGPFGHHPVLSAVDAMNASPVPHGYTANATASKPVQMFSDIKVSAAPAGETIIIGSDDGRSA